MAKLVNCKACGEPVSKNAPTCPKCGEPVKKKPRQYGCGTLLVLLFIIFIFYAVTQTSTSPDRSNYNTSSTSQTKKETKIRAPDISWKHYTSKDVMTGESQSFANSISVSPTRTMSFPYHDTKAWVGVGCDGDSEWAYIGFTSAPNLDDTEIEDGYNRINTRIKWDEKLTNVKLTQKWGAEFIHFSNDRSAIANFATSNSVLLELKWHSQELVHFEFPMKGSSTAISTIRSECSKY